MPFSGRLFVLAVLFFCVAGIAAEEDQGENKESGNSLISRIRKNHHEDEATNRLSNNFLLVRSPDGRGSAFLTRLWNQPVIVTNAHVYLEMKDPEIVDINGKVFKIKEVLGSKSRDLVILSYENADPKAEMLETADDVAAIPPSTPVIAYGNSLGDDVIVTQSGKLLGIGPDKIETDAPFVGGNSGGPVLLSNGNEVIGVATYLRHIEPDATTVGSKYESSPIKQVVRRFATRIDNLNPDDLEVIVLENIITEQDLVCRSNEWVEQIRRMLDKPNLERIRKFREDSLTRLGLFKEGETVKWHSNYLKNKFTANCNVITQVLKILDFDKTTPASQINTAIQASGIEAILERNAQKLNPIKQKSVSVRCFFCKGSGRYSEKRLNPQYKSNAPCPRYIYNHVACPLCGGSGKRALYAEQSSIAVPPEVTEEIGKQINVCEEKFYGFQLGGKREDELKRFAFYQKKPLYIIPNPFGETLTFEGNHQDRTAACTIFTFMFDRLLQIAIIAQPTSASYNTYGESSEFDRRSNKSSPMTVSVSQIRSPKEVPVDLRGNPLLKPSQQKDDFDQPAMGGYYSGNARDTDTGEPQYRGTMTTGSHLCLDVINQMDLPALAERCRESKK